MNKLQKGKLHFHVSGEFLTNHCRNLWTEGRPDFAIRTLVTSLIGMTEGWAIMICTGKKKLVGWDNDVSMVDDKVANHNGMKLLSMEEILKHKDEEAKLKEREQRELDPDDVPFPKLKNPVMSIFDLSQSRQISNQALLNFSNIMAFQSMQNQKRMDREENKQEPKSLDDFKITNGHWTHIKYGWIDKQGNPYDAAMGRGDCLFDAHVTMAGLCGIRERELEEKGWIKITVSVIEGLMVIPTSRPTKVQKEMVAEFCQKNKIKEPRWWD